MGINTRALPKNRPRLLVLARQPQILVTVTFVALISVGTLLFSLPIAHRDSSAGLIDNLFMMTSAVCVTGLTVLDVGNDLTPFGQIVILSFIQLGGLGITVFAFLAVLAGKSRLSFTVQAALGESIFQRDRVKGIHHVIRVIILATFCVEAVGAVLIYVLLPKELNVGLHGIFIAIFHSISAFCNAGFSLFSDSLVGFDSNPLLLLVFASLIFLGGIGFPVILEMIDRIRGRGKYFDPTIRFSLTSRVALKTSFLLIVLGTVLLYASTISDPGTHVQTMISAAFHSVSARTAGFSVTDLAGASHTTLIILIVLMYIGGSPCSAAGGVKTTSIAIWLASMKTHLRGQEEVVLGGASGA